MGAPDCVRQRDWKSLVTVEGVFDVGEKVIGVLDT